MCRINVWICTLVFDIVPNKFSKISDEIILMPEDLKKNSTLVVLIYFNKQRKKEKSILKNNNQENLYFVRSITDQIAQSELASIIQVYFLIDIQLI